MMDLIGDMNIEELKEWELESGEEELILDVLRKEIIVSDAKRALVGAGARVLFYPTLLYNILRNKIQSEFRWWDGIDEFILLGAVPFPTDVPRLKELGVCGVITLNEPYETLVPTSLYHTHGIDHLVIPTRDYLFAPSYGNICQAVDFIHENASSGTKTYVHCKAGRGRSTTIVLCYLVQHKKMTPDTAYEYVKSIRPRVLLASAQWQAVQEFYHQRVRCTGRSNNLYVETPLSLTTLDNAAFNDGSVMTKSDPNHFDNPVVKASGSSTTTGNIATFDNSSIVPLALLNSNYFDNPVKTPGSPTKRDPADFDDSSVVLITESDLDGYDANHNGSVVGYETRSDISRFQFASQAALTRFLGLGFRRKTSGEKMGRESTTCSVEADQLGGLLVDMHVF